MAALDFPDTPTVGQLYGSSGTVWRWDGARWASTAGASGARGRVAYAEIRAPQGGITSAAVDIAGLSVTWTADPTRTYRTTVVLHLESTVATDIPRGSIVDGTGAGKQYCYNYAGIANVAQTQTFSAVESGLSGSATRKVQVYRQGGTGTLTCSASAVLPAFILVEDITYEAGTSGQPGPGVGGPTGVVAIAQVTTSQSGIPATLTDVTGMVATWTADPSRTYKTTVFFTPSSSVASDDLVAAITDAANAQKQGWVNPGLDPNSSTSTTFSAVETGLSGSVTRKLRIRGTSGSVANYGTPTQPSYILVEDITYDPGVPGGGGTGFSEIVGRLANPYTGTNVLAPPAKMEIETGSVVCLLAGGGWGSFLFRTQFAQPPLTIAMNGDNTVGHFFLTSRGAAAANGYAFALQSHDGSTPPAGTNVRISYIAIGYI